MATRKSRKKPSAPVVKRGRDERQRLPADLEAFARSDERRLRRERKDRRRLNDPRPSANIPGVRNLDARDFHDARAEAMEALLAGAKDESEGAPEDRRRLAVLLAEALLLGHHRGRSFVSFDAFVDAALGLDPAEARALAAEGVDALDIADGDLSPLTEESVAVWVRAESALAAKGLPGIVSVSRDGEGRERLRVDVPTDDAARALYAIGGRLGQLAADQEPEFREHEREPERR